MITIYKDIFTTGKGQGYYVHPETVAWRIRTGKNKELIEKIRAEKDDDKRNELKKGLPCIIFQGEFERRAKSGIVNHSGLIALDLDHVKDLEGMREKIAMKPCTYMVFRSPSGDGLKIVTRIPKEPRNHELYFNALYYYYGRPDGWDRATKDISRVCYESYDPNIYFNPNADVFSFIVKNDPEVRKKRVFTSKDMPYKKARDIVDKGEAFVKGNRNNYIFKLAAFLKTTGMSRGEIEQNLIGDFSSGSFKPREIKQTVNNVYRYTK